MTSGGSTGHLPACAVTQNQGSTRPAFTCSHLAGTLLAVSSRYMNAQTLLLIGRVPKKGVEKGRPSTRQLITGVPPVTFTTGASETDHSGVAPVKIRWSGT